MAISHSTSMVPSPEGTLANGHTASTDSTTVAPIIIDLGKKKRKQIKALKRGSGKLMDEVGEVLNQVRGSLGSEAELKNLVPVVMLYRRKGKRRTGLLSL